MKYHKICGGNLIWADFCATERVRGKEKRFRTCKATWGTTENGEFTYLRSYETIVLVIDNDTGEAMDVSRTEYGYTATTAQHISKFLKEHKHTVLYRTNTDRNGKYYIRIY